MKTLPLSFRLHPLFAVLSVASTAMAQTPPESTPAVALDSVVHEIVANNPELAFYEAELAAARGGRRQAGILDNPELSADLGGKRVRGAGLSSEGTAWSVSVTQTFEYPGRMSLRKAIANRDIELAELGLAQFKAALESRATIASHHLLAARQKAEAASAVADRLQELLSFLVQREPGGITPLIEVRIIEASVATFRKQAIEANQELQSALFQVNVLRGKPLGTPLKVAPTTLEFAPPPPMETLLAAARKDSFELRMRQAELEQQGLKVSLSRNQRWPEIAVGPFVSQEDAEERETVAGIGLSLPLPVWNRNAGNIDVERARQQQAETSLHLTQLHVEQAVMENYLAYRLNAEELQRWDQSSIQRFQEAAELGDRHYRLGSLPIATYIEMQREFLDALDSILSLEAETLAAQQQLEVLTRLAIGATSEAGSEAK